MGTISLTKDHFLLGINIEGNLYERPTAVRENLNSNTCEKTPVYGRTTKRAIIG